MIYTIKIFKILRVSIIKNRFSTKSDTEKVLSSVLATNTQIVTEGSPQSQESVERSLEDTSNTDVKVMIENLDEKIVYLNERLAQKPSTLDYEQQQKQLQDLIDIISGDKTSFIETA